MNIYKRIGISILSITLACAFLYFGALITIPNVVDLNKYKDSVFSIIEEKTGFKVSCEDISFQKSLTPYFKIKMHHYIVLYPSDEVFLKIKDADLKVKIIPLLFKKIVVKDANFKRPIINVTLYKDFTTSFDRYINLDNEINTNGYNLDGVIKDTVCERYKLKIFDETTNKTFYVEGDNLKILDLIPNERVNVVLKGALFESEKEFINYDVNIKSYIGKVDNKLTVSPFEQILNYDVKGNVVGNIEIAKNNLLKGNLDINNFSLKLDDNVLKNNNAKLIFKGEEVSIDSILHTSKTDEAKVKGKFNFGKKKFIDLAVNAKNIKIEKLQKIINVFSQSLNIPDKFTDVKLTGILNADFTVNSDFKKLKSSGIADVINAEVSHKEIPYKINKINSHINFCDNKINIEKAQAYVNSTPVNVFGTINEDMTTQITVNSENLDLSTISGLFFKKQELPFEFMKGKLSFSSELKGKIDKDWSSNTTVLINNFNAVEKTQRLPISVSTVNLKIENNKDKFSGNFICNEFSSIFNKNLISSELLKISFDDKNIKIDDGVLKVINSPITFKGKINNYLEEITGHIDFSGDILSQDIANLISSYVNQPYKAVGKIKTVGAIDFSKDGVKINSKLRADKDNYLSYVVIKELLNKQSILNIDALIKDKDITIKDISLIEDVAQKNEPRMKLAGQIINEKEPIFKNFRIQIPDVISASMNFLGGEEISFVGDIVVNDTLKNLDIKGNIKVYSYIIKKLYTAVKNADISLNKDNIRIIAPDVIINTSKFNAVIDLTPVLSDVINVTNAEINSLNLDLNTLFSIIDNERSPFAKTMLNIKKGSATINNFQVIDLKARDISTDFSLKDNILKFEGISANAYNGKISGAFNYDINHSQLNLNLIGKDLDIKTSLYDLCKLEDNMSGKMDFTSSVSLRTGDYESVIKSLSGKITFDAKEGKIGTLGKFEYYMNAQNLLYHGLLNATLNRIVDAVKPDNTARFKTAKGSIFLQNGYMIIEELRTCGQNMSLYMKGRYNMLLSLANIDIYGRISDEIKSKLGSFADVSISELVNGKQSKKYVSTMPVQAELIENIHLWNNENNQNTNTFKVNINGNVNYPSAINSFTWVVSDEKKNEDLPEFSEIPQSL